MEGGNVVCDQTSSITSFGRVKVPCIQQYVSMTPLGISFCKTKFFKKRNCLEQNGEMPSSYLFSSCAVFEKKSLVVVRGGFS